MGKYQAGAASGASFALACFAFLAGGPWSRFHESGGVYFAGAALGGLVAFTAATLMHGRRVRPGSAPSALASMAFGWTAAIAGVILAWMALWVLLAALFAVSGFPAGLS
jgi:hypothetical protein